MSHFGRSGPPDIRDTFSLLVLNISFRTTADDLYPLFERYGKVVDVFIPRDRRTGDSRGFAFVRYKYADEAQKAIDRLDGRNVDGRNIMVQFAKYGPNAEPIQKGRVKEGAEKSRDRSRSRSPRPSASPARRSASPHKSPPPRRSPTPEKHTNGKDSPLSRSVSPSPKRASSHSPGSDGKNVEKVD
uniref:Arginine/serine-rich splicing factor SC31 transcript V n=1 Tax=Sorghum bicolor TaxID=4558 RepID=M1HAH7_SORBI|nr:arginine/serine-rich splicing factor SC31 transcript V [Sorghum bicolor]